MKYYKDDRGAMQADWNTATFVELREEEAWSEKICALCSPADPAHREALICLKHITDERTRRAGGPPAE